MNHIIHRASLFRTLRLLCLASCAFMDHRGEVHAEILDVVRQVQPKVVKLYGAGGLRRLEAYQTGLLISAEGHVLTLWSYVLDSDVVTVVLDDGQRFEARLMTADPLTEVAVLQLTAVPDALPHFDLRQAVEAEIGTRILAFSNLFGIATGNEPVSVMHGTVCGIAPLAARRGAFAARYQGEVYVLDAATSNPGAAGGVLVDTDGNLLGILGKEARSQLTNTWLNFALPVAAFQRVVDDIIAGRFEPDPLDDLDFPDNPLVLPELGIVLVPEVVARTPPFVDRVVPASPAALAGVLVDDLVVMVDGQPTNSCRELNNLLNRYESGTAVEFTVLRGLDLVQLTVQPISE